MELQHNHTYRNRRGGLVTVHRKFIERPAPFCDSVNENVTYYPDGRCYGRSDGELHPEYDLVELVRSPNAFKVLIKIEVVNDHGEPVNIKGYPVSARKDSEHNQAFPLVTCTLAGEFETPKDALARLNKLHAVVSPLKDL